MKLCMDVGCLGALSCLLCADMLNRTTKPWVLWHNIL